MPAIKVTAAKGLHQVTGTTTIKSGTLSGHAKVVTQVDGNTTLTVDDSGKIFTLVGTGAYALTLPTATTSAEADALLGWNVIVINEVVDASNSDDRTIVRGDTGNDTLIGNIIDAAADGAVGLTLGSHVITFDASAADAPGDMVEIFCFSADATNTKFVARGICAA
jgi:hypothetical protein